MFKNEAKTTSHWVEVIEEFVINTNAQMNTFMLYPG